MKLSIIIPIYNQEKHLRQCLESVLKQTFTDYEIIIINDGSTDNSSKICLEYQDKFKNFKYHYQKNGGPSSSRNHGIKISTGEWITFIDNDDYISNNTYETIFKYINDEKYKDLDCFQFGQNRFDSEHQWIDDQTLNMQTGLFDFYKNKPPRWMFVWNKIFRASVIKENDIYFYNSYDGREVNGEDYIFIQLFGAYANKKILAIKDLLYNHRYEDGTLTKISNLNPSLKAQKTVTAWSILREDLIKRNKLTDITKWFITKRLMDSIKTID